MPRNALPPRLYKRQDTGYWFVRDRSSRYPTGTRDEKEAREWLNTYTAELERPEIPDQPTIADLVDLTQPIRLTGASDEKQLKFFGTLLVKDFGSLTPEQITPSSLAPYMEPSKRRLLEELRATLKSAQKQGWIEKAPEITMPPKYPSRTHYLTKDEVNRLLKETERTPHLKLFVMIALATGQRRGAILSLTWDRVDLKNGVIDFNEPGRVETKKRRAVVPIAPTLLTALRSSKRDGKSQTVIEWNGLPVSRIDTALNKAAARAGVKCTAHTLKHTAISLLAQAKREDGSSMFTVDDIADLTETTPEVIKRVYRKVNPEALRPMADALGAVLGE